MNLKEQVTCSKENNQKLIVIKIVFGILSMVFLFAKCEQKKTDGEIYKEIFPLIIDSMHISDVYWFDSPPPPSPTFNEYNEITGYDTTSYDMVIKQLDKENKAIKHKYPRSLIGIKGHISTLRIKLFRI